MGTNPILQFNEEYHFLSNFSASHFIFMGEEFATNEHFYQAAKAVYPEDRNLIINAETPGLAKKLGRVIQKHPRWNLIKLSVMELGLRLKFENPNLRELLIQTHRRELIEGNHWGDTFWGVYKNEGQNHLGKLLMKIRKEYDGFAF